MSATRTIIATLALCGGALCGGALGCAVSPDVLGEKPCPCAPGFRCTFPEEHCVPDDGQLPRLLARFDCDLLEDNQLEDRTGNGNTARCDALGCPRLLEGLDAMACTFDGTGQRVRVAHRPEFASEAGFTALVSIFPHSVARGSVIGVPFGDGILNSWQLFLSDVAGELRAGFVSNATEDAETVSFTPLPLSTWTNVALVFDGSDRILYINGVEKGRVGPVTVGFEGRDLLIGADENSGDVVLPFDGRVDNIEVYEGALDADTIAVQHMLTRE